MSTETPATPLIREHNGQAPADQRARFGPGPTETIPAEWVEPFLTFVKDYHPLVFAAAIQRGVLGIDGKPARPRS